MAPLTIAILLLIALGVALGAWALARRAAIAGRSTPELELPAAPSAPAPSPVKSSVTSRFFAGLTRSRDALASALSRAFGGGQTGAGWVAAVEEALIGADVGVRAAADLAETLRGQAGTNPSPGAVRALLRSALLAHLGPPTPIATVPSGPLVILVVGVNGSGKTTTIGKLAARYAGQGKRVLLAAGDTFRAGAIEQLKVWGTRANVPVVAHQEGADPAAVIFDGVQAAISRGMDVVICDTAGRLQAQKPLMDELGKVVRVMRKALPSAPHEVLLVLDATIGQNALSQARIFKEVVGVTGVVLTKLDGTARGGVVVAVAAEMGLPVKLVGLGEKTEDLRDFDPVAFVDALVPEDLGASAS